MLLRTFNSISIFCLLGLLMQLPAMAQQDQSGYDSVQIRYDFTPGKSVLYRVISYDSVMVYGGHQRKIVRERVEMVRYTCDSLVGGDYAMTATLEAYGASERRDDQPPVTLVDDPWVGRRISFIMTPFGQRTKLLTTDSLAEPGTAPGAPFKPLLLPYMGGEHAHIGSSGSFRFDQMMVENVYPPVTLHGTSFRIIPGRADTLGQKTIQLGFSDVGNVTYNLQFGKGKDGEDLSLKSETVVNASGQYYLAPALGYMAGGQYVLYGDFTMTLSTGGESKGRHIISMIYSIAEPEQ